jgi:GNAT superfamily N-acetyltransferase
MRDGAQIGYTIDVAEAPDLDDLRLVGEGLTAYNNQHAPEFNWQRLAVFLRDREGKLVGGLTGGTYWGWLYVEDLWVPDCVRRQGWGTRLLQAAEQAARRRGCRHVHLDTMSFQALPFYQKQGYTVFGILEDLPEGHRRYYLRKDLEE